jgi:MFS family permease
MDPLGRRSRVWRRRRRNAYRYLLGAAYTSYLGDGLVVAALPLLATTLTRRPLLISGLLTSQQLPWLLFGIPAGAVVDRLERGNLMRSIDISRMLITALFSLAVALRRDPIWLLYAFALVLGTFQPPFSGATNSLLPDLVPADALGRANGQLMVAQSIGEQTAGPALGSFLYSLAKALPFAGDSLSFALSAAFLGRVRGWSSPPTEESAGSGVISSLRLGLSEWRKNSVVKSTTLMLSTITFFQSMVFGLLVLYALEQIHLPRVDYGLFLAVAALGNAAGGTAAAALSGRANISHLVVVGIAIVGATWIGLGLTHSIPVAFGVAAIEGLATSIASVAATTLRQLYTKREVLGRVTTFSRSLVVGAGLLGSIFGGLLASAHGISTTMVIAGLGGIGTACVFALPVVRSATRSSRAQRS